MGKERKGGRGGGGRGGGGREKEGEGGGRKAGRGRGKEKGEERREAERKGGRKKGKGKGTKKKGLLPLTAVSYGYATNTRVKFILVSENWTSQSRDADMKMVSI